MNEIAVIMKVSKNPSKNNKVQILKDNDSKELRELLNLAFNPFIIFGLKKVSYNETSVVAYDNTKHKEFVELANYCATHNTDDNKRDLVMLFLNKCNQPQQNIYADILIKKLRIGATVSTCNKAFGKNFIPEFKIMLADTDNNLDLDTRKIVQEKYDGVRCVILKENGKCKAYTRQGKPIHLENIFKVLENNPSDNYMLDGELTGGNRTETTSITSKLLKGNTNVTDDKLVFNAFDMIPVGAFYNSDSTETEPLHTRLLELEKFIKVISEFSKRLTFADTHITKTRQEVMKLYNQVVAKGGEGLIVKVPDSLYSFKRSKDWAKLKEINYCTLKIVNIVEGTGKHMGKLGAITCQSSDEEITISVGTGFSDELRETMWGVRDKLIGRFVEIKFNELQYDREGNPYLFLPVFVETRVDKTEADSLPKIRKECGLE